MGQTKHDKKHHSKITQSKKYSSKFNTYCGSTINNYKKIPIHISQYLSQKLSKKIHKSHSDKILDF